MDQVFTWPLDRNDKTKNYDVLPQKTIPNIVRERERARRRQKGERRNGATESADNR